MIQTGRLIVYKTIFTAKHEHDALMSDSHLSNLSAGLQLDLSVKVISFTSQVNNDGARHKPSAPLFEGKFILKLLDSFPFREQSINLQVKTQFLENFINWCKEKF